jgi:hypothetical protein
MEGYFKDIPDIKYEGSSSKNVLAFKYYNKDEVILGKKMKDWLRFSVRFPLQISVATRSYWRYNRQLIHLDVLEIVLETNVSFVAHNDCCGLQKTHWSPIQSRV